MKRSAQKSDDEEIEESSFHLNRNETLDVVRLHRCEFQPDCIPVLKQTQTLNFSDAESDTLLKFMNVSAAEKKRRDPFDDAYQGLVDKFVNLVAFRRFVNLSLSNYGQYLVGVGEIYCSQVDYFRTSTSKIAQELISWENNRSQSCPATCLTKDARSSRKKGSNITEELEPDAISNVTPAPETPEINSGLDEHTEMLPESIGNSEHANGISESQESGFFSESPDSQAQTAEEDTPTSYFDCNDTDTEGCIASLEEFKISTEDSNSSNGINIVDQLFGSNEHESSGDNLDITSQFSALNVNDPDPDQFSNMSLPLDLQEFNEGNVLASTPNSRSIKSEKSYRYRQRPRKSFKLVRPRPSRNSDESPSATLPEHSPLSFQDDSGLSTTMTQEMFAPLTQSTEMGDVQPERRSCSNKTASDLYLPTVLDSDEMEKIKSCVENLFDLAYNHTTFSALAELDVMSVLNGSKKIIDDIFVKHDLNLNLESTNTNYQNGFEGLLGFKDIDLNSVMLPHEPIILTGDGENATLQVNETNCKESRELIKKTLRSFSIPTVEKYTFKSLIQTSSEDSIKSIEMFHLRMKKIFEKNNSVMNIDDHNEYKQNFVNVIQDKAKQVDKNETFSAPLTDVLYEFGTTDERELKRSFETLMHLLADKKLAIKCEKDSEMLVQEQDPNNEFQPSRSNGCLQIANDNIHIFLGEKWSDF